jgi:hypothetical protein
MEETLTVSGSVFLFGLFAGEIGGGNPWPIWMETCDIISHGLRINVRFVLGRNH